MQSNISRDHHRIPLPPTPRWSAPGGLGPASENRPKFSLKTSVRGSGEITAEFVGFIPQSLVLRSIVLG